MFARLVDGKPLMATWRRETGEAPVYRFYPDGEETALPPGPPREPEEMIDGNLVRINAWLPDGGDLISFQWAPLLPTDRPPFRTILAVRDSSGRITRAFDQSVSYFYANLSLDRLGVLGLLHLPPTGDQPGGPLLARFDLSTGTMHPVPEASAGLSGRLYPHIVDTVRGALLVRVAIPGDCLNVRSTPSLGAALVGCAAHGSVLASSGETVTEGGVEWLAIAMADGRSGHVNARFLER